MIRCKFKCVSTTTQEGSRQVDGVYQKCLTYGAKMQAVYGDSEDNKKFWDATPGGSLEVYCVNQMPWVVGGEYYIDITPA